MENNPKIWWVRAHLWQFVQTLHPIEASTKEDAIKVFREATATARDVVIEGVSTDIEELVSLDNDDDDTPPNNDPKLLN